MLYLLCSLVGAIIFLALAHWIFDVSRHFRYQKAQTKLLAKIAEAQGVPTFEVNDILGKIKDGVAI